MHAAQPTLAAVTADSLPPPARADAIRAGFLDAQRPKKPLAAFEQDDDNLGAALRLFDETELHGLLCSNNLLDNGAVVGAMEVSLRQAPPHRIAARGPQH